MNKRKVGSYFEELAKNKLVNNGYRIIEKNFFTNIGEIDIIAKDKDYLVFIEVKYRNKDTYGLGYEAVTKKKQNTILKVAKYYLYKNKISENIKIRFDVVSIDNKEIQIIKNAFP